MVNQESRYSEIEPVAVHGLCCDSPLKAKSELPSKLAEEAHNDEQRPKYSLPCD